MNRLIDHARELAKSRIDYDLDEEEQSYSYKELLEEAKVEVAFKMKLEEVETTEWDLNEGLIHGDKVHVAESCPISLSLDVYALGRFNSNISSLIGSVLDSF